MEVQSSTKEVDYRLEVVLVPVATGAALDSHDFAVEAFGHGVGDPVPTEGHDVLQVVQEHPVLEALVAVRALLIVY